MGWDCDFLVIGSGFGGSVAALRLAEKGYRVTLVEQGRRWGPEDLPASTWSLHRWLWAPALGLRGFFGMRIFRHLVVLHGNAYGGGSITYANTLLVPPGSVWDQGSWAGTADWARVMPGHFARAEAMLGVTPNRLPGPADARLEEMARATGHAASYRLTRVGVHFGPEGGEPGALHPDPYFGGRGPARRSCTGCGGCMIGCRIGAKNTLDRTYLHLAEAAGALVHTETRVTELRPRDGGDGAAGYVVRLRANGPAGRRGRLSTRGVVVAASALGTLDLLLRMREAGALPRLSPMLGRQVRTNAESLIGIRYPGSAVDLGRGVAIGSALHVDAHTHVEAVRYPAGSDTMALLTTVMDPRAGRRRTRPAGWARTLLALLAARPRTALALLRPRNWAREVMILLCMQTLDGQLTMRLRRRRLWPFARRLATSGARVPAHIPAAQDFALKAAAATGGVAMTSLAEVFLNIPTTAHCMGGAVIGRGPESGVCDGRQRVFGYRNLYICDGSVIGANLGVNPSLTITALAEHAMSHVPAAAQADWTATGQEMP